MEYVDLFNLIKYLEHGTKLHIGVNFFGGTLNKKCILPHNREIHSKIICEQIKKDPTDYEKCFKCRNYAFKKALRYKKPFGALCINGVYEYTRPVIVDNTVPAIIFIGNILTEEGRAKLLQRFSPEEIPEDTMETNFDYEMCDKLGQIIEGHIITLLEKYTNDNMDGNPVIENIKAFILENLEYDLTVSDIASLFHYNDVYLGRLFKEVTAQTVKEYINSERIKFAKKLLKSETNITEIAKETGFNSVPYFTRVFKKITGMSPTEYRIKHSR